jgi:hypothetical protein
MSDKNGEERLIITDEKPDYTAGFVPPYKVFGGGLSFLLFITRLPATVIGVRFIARLLRQPASPEIFSYLKFGLIAAVGIFLYSLHFNNHRKAKKNDHALFEYSSKKRAEYQEARRRQEEERQEAQRKKEEQYLEALRKREEARQALLDGKVNAILGHELFDGAKVFVINQDNIIAFSKQRHIALFTEKDDTALKIIGVDHITKITQEIKAGACYAHIYTDDFDNNVIDLFIGTASGKEETEEVRKLYIVILLINSQHK